MVYTDDRDIRGGAISQNLATPVLFQQMYVCRHGAGSPRVTFKSPLGSLAWRKAEAIRVDAKTPFVTGEPPAQRKTKPGWVQRGPKGCCRAATKTSHKSVTKTATKKQLQKTVIKNGFKNGYKNGCKKWAKKQAAIKRLSVISRNTEATQRS